MSVHPCPSPYCQGQDDPALTSDPLCPRCTRRLAATLAELPALFAHLHVELTPSLAVAGEPVTGTRPAAAPLRESHLDHALAMATLVVGWETALVTERRLAPRPVAVRPGVALQRAAETLCRHLAAALALPDGVAHAVTLLAAVHTARRLLGWSLLVHDLAAPCPQCDHRALVRYDGDDYVLCRMCNAAWPEEHYRLLVRALLDQTRYETYAEQQ